MGHSSAVLPYLFTNLGPLIVFYPANHFYGFKIAIASAIVFSIAGRIYLNDSEEAG
jgi:hypothetical protein